MLLWNKVDRLEKFLRNYDSNTTIKAYKWILGAFIKSIYGDKKNLSEKIEQYFSENRNYEEDIENFQIKLNGRPPLTVRHMLSNVKTFLEENDVELSKKFWTKIRRRRKGNRAISLDEIPEKSQLKQIFTHMNAKGKALYFMLSSSGMRIGEALQLELDDINLEVVPTTIKILGKYTKTGSSRYSFISQEATEALKEWLKIREESLVTLVHRSNINRREKINNQRIFPFEHSTARFMWNEALRKAKLNKKDKTTRRMVFHPHVLRKYFRTQMAKEIQADIVEALIGHEGYLTQVYRKYSRKDLAKFYVRGEYTISIFRDTGDLIKVKDELEKEKSDLTGRNTAFQKWFIEVRQENVELKKLFDKEKKELTVVKNFQKKLEDEGKDLKAQLKSAIEMVYSFEPILNTFSEIANSLEGQELIQKIREAKIKQEMSEAQEEANNDS